jgi:hypothetical protein
VADDGSPYEHHKPIAGCSKVFETLSHALK